MYFHVHIEYQGLSAKIQVTPTIEVVENNRLKQQIIRKSLKTVEFFKEDIIKKWHKVFDK